jgi:protein required for attachment to host cells
MAAIWVLIADGAKARLFAADAPTGALEERETFVNPDGRAKQRDLKTDRPGATSPRMGRGRRATEPDVSPREHALQLFAKLLVDHLEAGRTGNDFERLVLVAAPAFLGMMRDQMSAPLKSLVSLELDKDFVALGPAELRARLPKRL